MSVAPPAWGAHPAARAGPSARGLPARLRRVGRGSESAVPCAHARRPLAGASAGPHVSPIGARGLTGCAACAPLRPRVCVSPDCVSGLVLCLFRGPRAGALRPVQPDSGQVGRPHPPILASPPPPRAGTRPPPARPPPGASLGPGAVTAAGYFGSPNHRDLPLHYVAPIPVVAAGPARGTAWGGCGADAGAAPASLRPLPPPQWRWGGVVTRDPSTREEFRFWRGGF